MTKKDSMLTESFLDLCKKRCSVRSYSPEPVARETLEYIMECVRLAPSAVNFQPWTFIEISEPAKREMLQRCYNRDWFKTAPAYFLICRNKQEEWVRKKDGKPHGDIDVAIATEHFCLAAAEQGVGTCWVCNFDNTLCKELFSLADDLEPVAILPFGYPAEDNAVRQTRKAIEHIWKESVPE